MEKGCPLIITGTAVEESYLAAEYINISADMEV